MAAHSVAARGSIPRHIAFIMDGNRRFAERSSLAPAAGHAQGYRRLIDALEWCLDMGVECVTAYAFSIDNFKRSDDEVAGLMALAEEKLTALLREEERGVLERHGVRVRVVGDMALAPKGVQIAAANVARATAHHSRAQLNICFAYTSSRELQHALDAAGHSGRPLDECLYTSDSPPVDLVIRTSGERRLSDFMLRQSSHALLVFSPVLWPSFGFLDLASAVMEYQRKRGWLEAARNAAMKRTAAVDIGVGREMKGAGAEASPSPTGVATPVDGCSTPSSDGLELDINCNGINDDGDGGGGEATRLLRQRPVRRP